MQVTILYDNDTRDQTLRADWGFSCLVEAHGKRILFDTGASGTILFYNMKKLGIDPKTIDEVFISHAHFDHTGGLFDFLGVNNTRVYLPSNILVPDIPGEFVSIQDPVKIHENIFSTGELDRYEQSLVVGIKDGVAVIVGCSHPGIGPILERAAQWGEVRALLGGFHGFKNFRLLENLDVICPTHCTQYKTQIKTLFPTKTLEGGVGRVIECTE